MKPESPLERGAIAITRWIGSLYSLAVHTVIFIVCFVAVYTKSVSLDEMLLVLTTVVSLEAIYLAIFIQMSVNRTSEAVEEVSEDVEEIQKDVDEMQEDVEEIQEDVDEIQKDVDELQEDVEEMNEEEKEPAVRATASSMTLGDIEVRLRSLLHDVETLQRK